MVQRIDIEERRARLVMRHRLARPERGSNPLDAVRSVVVLHSTDPVTVYLSVLARTEGVSPADVERSFYDERSLVRVLCMRRTLWAVPRELVPVVDAAAARAVAERERRRLEGLIRDSSLSARPGAWLTRAMNAAVGKVEELGEASTSELVAGVPLLAKPLRVGSGRWEVTQSAGSRVVRQLAMEGRLVRARPRGTWASGQYRWTTTAAWLGAEIDRLDPAPAQAELLRLWLAAFGPATEVDIRWWTGWTAREARAALAVVPHREVDLGGSTAYVLEDDLEPTPTPQPSAALLPTLDPTTMGWKERDWYLGEHAGTLFDSNGNAGPTVWWGGRVVGGWSQRRDGEIVFELLEDVGRDAVASIEAEAARVAAWLGDVRFSPGFLPPFQRSLAG